MLLFAFGFVVGIAQAAEPAPQYLFHFGEVSVMEQDVAENTIPENAWNRFIMGGDGRYALTAYRRGLYGASAPGYADYFGDLLVGSGKLPWMIAIEVTEECRTTRDIADIRELPTDARFLDWWDWAKPPQFRTPQDFEAQCYERWPNGKLKPRMIETGPGNGPCEDLVSWYLSETQVRVVVDQAWENSWYLRDRSCIAGIRGTATEQLDWMAHLPGYFSEIPQPGRGRRSSYTVPRLGASAFVILARALIETDSFMDWDALTLAIERSELSEENLSVPSGTDFDWFKETASELVAARREGRGEEALQEFLASLRQPMRSRTPEFMALIRTLRAGL